MGHGLNQRYVGGRSRRSVASRETVADVLCMSRSTLSMRANVPAKSHRATLRIRFVLLSPLAWDNQGLNQESRAKNTFAQERPVPPVSLVLTFPAFDSCYSSA